MDGLSRKHSTAPLEAERMRWHHRAVHPRDAARHCGDRDKLSGGGRHGRRGGRSELAWLARRDDGSAEWPWGAYGGVDELKGFHGNVLRRGHAAERKAMNVESDSGRRLAAGTTGCW